MTTIFYTHCKKMNEDRYKRGLSLLTPFMRDKIHKYIRWKDAHASLYGKLLLMEGMREFNFNNSLEQLKYTEFGKPYFPSESFSFNISHSVDYVVCVISNDKQIKLGIDLEKITSINFNNFDNIWSQSERSRVNNLQTFYTYWTRKEAVIKAVGRGLQIPLTDINVTQLNVIYEGAPYFLNKIEINNEYEVHLASSKKIEKYSVQYSALNWV